MTPSLCASCLPLNLNVMVVQWDFWQPYCDHEVMVLGILKLLHQTWNYLPSGTPSWMRSLHGNII